MIVLRLASRQSVPARAGRGALLVACVALAACATQPVPPPAVPTPPATTAPAAAPPAPAPTPFAYEDDAYYRLLIAEFAGQRGKLDVAIENYLDLAHRLRDPALAERATRIAVFARDDAAGLKAATIWVELEPDSMEARQILAAMEVRHGDADRALVQLEHVLSHDSGQPGTRLRMIASLLGHEDDRVTALAVMKRLVARHGEDSDALLAYALLAIRSEQLDDARDVMDRIAQRTELNTNVVMAYLAVLQKQGKLTRAVDWVDSLLQRNPKQFGLRLIYARLLADANRYEEARVQFTILAQQAPDNTDILYALGLLNLQANRADDAAKNFERLIKEDTRTDEAHYYLGQIAEAKRQPDAALRHYGRVQGGSVYFNTQMRVALLQASRSKVDDAVGLLDKLSPEDDNQRAGIVRVKGEILTEHRRYDEAMRVYDAALANGEYNTDLLYARAMLAEKLGKLDVLEADLRTIIKHEPENAQALNALGYTLADTTNRYEEALGLIQRALDISPKDFYILDSMGWVLYRLGRIDESIDFLQRARTLRNDPEVAAHLGEVLWVKGDREGARKTWNAALRETPNNEKLLEVIKRLAP